MPTPGTGSATPAVQATSSTESSERASVGLPVGLQLVAAPGREDLLVAVGREVEEAVAWPSAVPQDALDVV